MDYSTIERGNIITSQSILEYKQGYLLKIVDSLENEFEDILDKGFDGDSDFYEYIEDLRTVIGKLNE